MSRNMVGYSFFLFLFFEILFFENLSSKHGKKKHWWGAFKNFFKKKMKMVFKNKEILIIFFSPFFNTSKNSKSHKISKFLFFLKKLIKHVKNYFHKMKIFKKKFHIKWKVRKMKTISQKVKNEIKTIDIYIKENKKIGNINYFYKVKIK